MKNDQKSLVSMFVSILISTSLYGLNALAGEEVKSDNSKVNQKIEAHHESNTQEQGSSDMDIKTTQDIRQQVVSQDSFSTNAKNVKIITRKGKVILKGPVKTMAEKNKIESIATSIAGKTKVTNEITITK